MKTFIISILFILSSPCFSQTKIIDRSDKKAPTWLGKQEKEYIVVSARGEDLNAAQNRCLDNIRQAIISSVSVNITSIENSYDRQLREGDNYTIYGGYESEIQAVAAKFPFVTAISLSDAESYWEKVLNRKTGETYYEYHAKYPFPNARRDELITEFLKIDGEKEAQLSSLQDFLLSVDTVEDIQRSITECQILIDYFFDDARRSSALNLQRQFRQLYTSISAVVVSNTLGEHQFYLNLEGRRISTSKKPRINIVGPITDTTIEMDSNKVYHIKYNPRYCSREEDNTIILLYNFASKAFRHSFDVPL